MKLNLESEKLGEMLLDHGAIDQEELDHALEFQENVGGKLGEILIKLGYTTEMTIIEVIADQQNMNTVDLSELVLPENLIKEIPHDVIVEHEVIPVRLKGETLQLAIHDPFDYESLEEVGLATNYSVEPVLAPRAAILQAINDVYPDAITPESGEDLIKEGEQASESDPNAALDASQEPFDASTAEQINALVHLLVDKGVIKRDELRDVIQEHQQAKT